jgi:hypothetical protein
VPAETGKRVRSEALVCQVVYELDQNMAAADYGKKLEFSPEFSENVHNERHSQHKFGRSRGYYGKSPAFMRQK